MKDAAARFFVVLGVAGSGKTTIGQALASSLDCPFYDADDFHPRANKAKMASGAPLDDADRAPWLATLAELIKGHLEKHETGVLACSALKKRYREQLRVNEQVIFVFLDGSFELIWHRLQAREDHYMKAEMLHSQFETLEPPDVGEAIRIPIDRPVQEILHLILQAI